MELEFENVRWWKRDDEENYKKRREEIKKKVEKSLNLGSAKSEENKGAKRDG